MSGHTMRVEWDGYDGPTYTFACNEPPEAICRAVWDCGCEYFHSPGVDERGPYHEVSDRYMTDAERASSDRPRHYGAAGGECGQLLFITESGEEGYMGSGSITVPVALDWSPDDEAYLWRAT